MIGFKAEYQHQINNPKKMISYTCHFSIPFYHSERVWNVYKMCKHSDSFSLNQNKTKPTNEILHFLSISYQHFVLREGFPSDILLAKQISTKMMCGSGNTAVIILSAQPLCAQRD